MTADDVAGIEVAVASLPDMLPRLLEDNRSRWGRYLNNLIIGAVTLV